MSKYIKSFNSATDMRAYLDTATGMKYYLLKNENGDDGIGSIPESGKKIVHLFKGRDYLTFTAQQANSTVKFSAVTNSSAEYSLDGGITWTNAANKTITLTNIGDSVKYRGVISGNIPHNVGSRFSMSGKIVASGSVMSMYNNNPNDKVIEYEYAFNIIFGGCTSLITAPELPATTLARGCYYEMFYNCTSLTTAPELPATTLINSCYASMFNGCTSLTAAEIQATTLVTYCQEGMFLNCSSLSYVKIHSTNWSIYQPALNWLSGVAATGTVECPTASTIESNSVHGIPTGWTRVNF